MAGDAILARKRMRHIRDSGQRRVAGPEILYINTLRNKIRRYCDKYAMTSFPVLILSRCLLNYDEPNGVMERLPFDLVEENGSRSADITHDQR